MHRITLNIIIKDIKEIDEVKSGVEFFWSNEYKYVKNELDVVAIKDSVLICISCKDSDKYDENALNELEVHSYKLGGDKEMDLNDEVKLNLDIDYIFMKVYHNTAIVETIYGL